MMTETIKRWLLHFPFKKIALVIILVLCVQWILSDLGWSAIITGLLTLLALAEAYRRDRVIRILYIIVTVGATLWFFSNRNHETTIGLLYSILNLVNILLTKPLDQDQKRVKPNTTRAVMQQVQALYIKDKLPLLEQDDLTIHAVEVSATFKEKALPTLPDVTPTLAHELAYQRLKRSGRLLILGAAGAGKTTCLLQLTRHLIADVLTRRPDLDAVDYLDHVPAVFHLSTWSRERGSLEGWLTEQLDTFYDVDPQIGAALASGGRLILMLDGLDEVGPDHRAECVQAVNTYCRQHSHLIVVSCRVDEYRALPDLEEFDAILIQPLTEADVEAFLDRKGLRDVYTQIKQGQRLRSLARNPFFLKALTTALRGGAALPLAGETLSEAALQHAIFDHYVTQAFAHQVSDRRIHGIKIFDRDATCGYLTHLATYLRRMSLSQLYVDRVQPDILIGHLGLEYAVLVSLGLSLVGASAGTIALWTGLHAVVDAPAPVYGALLGALAIGTAAGLIGGTSIGLIAVGAAFLLLWIGARTWPDTNLVVASGLVGFSIGLVAMVNRELGYFLPSAISRRVFATRLTTALGTGAIVAGVVAWLNQTPALAVVQMTVLFGLLLLAGIGAGYAVRGHVIRVMRALRVAADYDKVKNDLEIAPRERLSWSWSGAISFFAIVLSVGLLIAWLVNGSPTIPLVFALTIAVFAGFQSREREPDPRIRLRPNYAIRRSIAYAAWVGLVMAALSLVLGLMMWSARDGLLFMLAIVPGATLAYGGLAVLQHYALRLVLARHGYIPLDIVNFLEYTSALMLTRRVGASYEFIHGLLQEHFEARGR